MPVLLKLFAALAVGCLGHLGYTTLADVHEVETNKYVIYGPEEMRRILRVLAALGANGIRVEPHPTLPSAFTIHVDEDSRWILDPVMGVHHRYMAVRR